MVEVSIDGERYHFASTFDNTREAAAAAREQAFSVARDRDFDSDKLFDFEIAVGEALANAVEHGERSGGSIRLEGWLSATAFEAAISDDGAGYACGTIATEHPGAFAPRGYGLFLIQALMDDVRFSKSGNSVWFLKRVTDDEYQAKLAPGAPIDREETVNAHLALVRRVAKRIAVNLPRSIDVNDLINDGIIGLMDAIQKFDDTRGVKFETYAVTRISGAILDGLRALDWVPRGVRQQARELERVHQQLEIECGRPATEEEVALRMGLTRKQLDVVRQEISGASVLSLQAALPLERDRAMPLLDRLTDAGNDAASVVEARELQAAVVRAVHGLPKQERTVISLYYFEGLAYKEIRNVLDVSESRISQIHSRAVTRLRHELHGLTDDPASKSDPKMKRRYMPKTRPA